MGLETRLSLFMTSPVKGAVGLMSAFFQLIVSEHLRNLEVVAQAAKGRDLTDAHVAA